MLDAVFKCSNLFSFGALSFKFENFELALGMQNGVAYVRVFVGILRDISKQETVEYMLAMVDEMLTGTLLTATRFHKPERNSVVIMRKCV